MTAGHTDSQPANVLPFACKCSAFRWCCLAPPNRHIWGLVLPTSKVIMALPRQNYQAGGVVSVIMTYLAKQWDSAFTAGNSLLALEGLTSVSSITVH